MWKFSIILMLLIASYVKSEYFEECSAVQDNTYIPLMNDCHSYIYCSDKVEKSFKDECPEGTFFEANEAVCVIDDHNVCPKKDAQTVEAELEIEETEKEELVTPAEAIAVTFITTATSSHSSTADKMVDDSVDLTPPRPVCDRNADKFYPHHERCKYYYKCVAGYLTILRCNFYYAWDYRKEMCVPKKEVQCYANAKL